ncbi:unnamed protein product [Cutaneotrichosporon oleaginosum]
MNDHPPHPPPGYYWENVCAGDPFQRNLNTASGTATLKQRSVRARISRPEYNTIASSRPSSNLNTAHDPHRHDHHIAQHVGYMYANLHDATIFPTTTTTSGFHHPGTAPNGPASGPVGGGHAAHATFRPSPPPPAAACPHHPPRPTVSTRRRRILAPRQGSRLHCNVQPMPLGAVSGVYRATRHHTAGRGGWARGRGRE